MRYTVERHVQGASAPTRYPARPFVAACDLATLLAWMNPAARVELHTPAGLVGVVADGVVRDPVTGNPL